MIQKFRVWDKKNNLGWFPHGEKQWGNLMPTGQIIHGYCDEADEFDPNRFVVCLSTGISDENGVLIHVGDIVETRYSGGFWIGEAVRLITAYNNGYYFRVIYGVNYSVDASTDEDGRWCNRTDGKDHYIICVEEDFVIIGNRFENPGLL